LIFTKVSFLLVTQVKAFKTLWNIIFNNISRPNQGMKNEKKIKSILYSAVLIGLVLTGECLAQARPKKQTQQLQMTRSTRQQMMQQQQFQRMNNLKKRFRNLNSELDTMANKQTEASELQMRYRNMQQLAEGIEDMANKIAENMQRLQVLENNREMQRDREINRDTTRIREQLNRMTDNLNEMLQSMERLQKRTEAMTK